MGMEKSQDQEKSKKKIDSFGIFYANAKIRRKMKRNVVRYGLSEDGKTYTATESFLGPIVKYDNVWVFDKEQEMKRNPVFENKE